MTVLELTLYSIDQAGLELRYPPAYATLVLGLKVCAITAQQYRSKGGKYPLYFTTLSIAFKHMGTGKHFLNITPVAQTLRATINKWDLLKLRTFYKAKDTVTKTKWQPTKWEKIFTYPTLDRRLISKIYKEFKKLDINIPNNPCKKWVTELNREFSIENLK